MTKIKEGFIELHMKSEGVHYAISLKIAEFPTEEKLVRGLTTMNQCLLMTLTEQAHWSRKE